MIDPLIESLHNPQEVERDAARLLRGITPGEWNAATTPHPSAVRLKKEAVSVYGPDCLIYSMARDYVCLPETWERQKRDAEFIAAAPRLIRGLLALLAASARPPAYVSEESIQQFARDLDFAVDVTVPRPVLLKRFEEAIQRQLGRWQAVPAREQGWRDIESAPKDGTWFLGAAKHKVYGWLIEKARFYDEDKHGNRAPYAVMEGGSVPTHFQLLPPPPRGSETP